MVKADGKKEECGSRTDNRDYEDISRLMKDEVGVSVADGLAEGINNKSPSVVNAVKDWFERRQKI